MSRRIEEGHEIMEKLGISAPEPGSGGSPGQPLSGGRPLSGIVPESGGRPESGGPLSLESELITSGPPPAFFS